MSYILIKSIWISGKLQEKVDTTKQQNLTSDSDKLESKQ